MKKTLSILSLLMLFACSNDDDGVTLDRKWYHVTKTVNGVPYSYTEGDCGPGYMQFYDGGHVREVDNTDCDNEEIWQGTYERNGDTIYVTVNTNVTPINILLLTENKFSFGYDYDFDGDGIEEVVVEEFKK